LSFAQQKNIYLFQEVENSLRQPPTFLPDLISLSGSYDLWPVAAKAEPFSFPPAWCTNMVLYAFISRGKMVRLSREKKIRASKNLFSPFLLKNLKWIFEVASGRATRRVYEKIAQNVAQSISRQN
jgi:hypothetical protein